MSTPLNTIFTWFETGDIPTQEQFQQTFSSFYHKDNLIPVAQIEGITELVEGFASAEALENHVEDTEAHHLFLAKIDASNLSDLNVESWQGILDLMILSEFVENGKIKLSKIEPFSIGGTHKETITDLTVGEKTITHNLKTEDVQVQFRDIVTKQEIKVKNFTDGINKLVVSNTIAFENSVRVLIKAN